MSATPGQGGAGSREGEGDFRVVGSETLLDAGFLSVARLHVAARDGEEFDRHVVHHPGAVVIVPVVTRPDGGSDAVLVRQWRVATGRTLEENDLEVREEILECTARFVANRVAHKLRASEVDELTAKLREASGR